MLKSVLNDQTVKDAYPREVKSRLEFQCHKTHEFDKAFRKLDKLAQATINNTINQTLFSDPYESKRLVDPRLKGKRSIRAGNYRVVFAVCEECRKQHEERLNHCQNCDRNGANNIVVFTCGHRNHIYDT
jgi:mRNA-degrading endonuclease RelE of RelBE toxin-antitoxin system